VRLSVCCYNGKKRIIIIVKLLATSGSDIVHIDSIPFVGKPKAPYRSLNDRSAVVAHRKPFAPKGFDFMPDDPRSGSTGFGLGPWSPQQEIAVAYLISRQDWSFTVNNEIFTVEIERALPDERLRAGARYIHSDALFLIKGSSAMFSQLRGRLYIIINSHCSEKKAEFTERIVALQNHPYFILQIDLPFAVCKKRSGSFSPEKLASIQSIINTYLDSIPNCSFVSRPGWCEGVPSGSSSGSAGSTASSSGMLDFSQIPSSSIAQRIANLFSGKHKKSGFLRSLFP